MAVETPHMELFPLQSLANSNREFIKPNQVIADIYNTQMMKVDSAPPLAAIMPENQLPFYQSTNICHPASAKTSMNKSESVVTYNIPSSQRKRPRNSTTDSNANDLIISEKNKLFRSEQSFLDQDTIYQFQQQQSEIEFFIAQHAEKMKLEMEERRIRQSTMWLSAIQETVMKKLKGKDEEIQRMGKLNWVLQERAKSLSVENQIWMDLAQNNEAAANSLRNDLENILAHFNKEHHNYGCAAVDPLSDDAESCCGSNDLEGEGKEETATVGDGAAGCGGGLGIDSEKRMCKSCGVRESIVLLLPCRHLCLCTICGSTLRTCPVCQSGTNASVHVNFS